MSSDAQIARQWAEKARENDLLDEVPLEGYRAAARHILATTTPPTMADIEWQDDVHAGLCAEHCDGYEVLMLGKESWDDDRIYCRWTVHGEVIFGPINRHHLTPIPGTKIDLTPRREPEPEPEFTPDHPAVLTTRVDYTTAPVGTIVAEDGASPWIKDDMGFWIVVGDDESETSWAMAGIRRRVLRWGWEA